MTNTHRSCFHLAGTLYVFILVCSGVLYMRFHTPGSGSSPTPILAALLAMVLLALGAPSCCCCCCCEGGLEMQRHLLLAALLCVACGACCPPCPRCTTTPVCAGFSLAFTMGAGWPTCLTFILLFGLVVCGLYLLPVAHIPERFRVPFFPATPALGILLTVHLFGSLGWPAYIRFGLWMVAGLTVYACFGVHGAEEREREHIRCGGGVGWNRGDAGHCSVQL